MEITVIKNIDIKFLSSQGRTEQSRDQGRRYGHSYHVLRNRYRRWWNKMRQKLLLQGFLSPLRERIKVRG